MEILNILVTEKAETGKNAMMENGQGGQLRYRFEIIVINLGLKVIDERRFFVRQQATG